MGGIPSTFDGKEWGGLDLREAESYGSKGDGLTTRIRVERIGDVIRAYAGIWDEADVDPASLIELDLAANTVNGDPAPEGVDLGIFRGPKQYGYYTYSQRGSTYLDVVFDTGYSPDTAILLTGGSDTDGDGEDDRWTGSEVWRFDEVGGWQQVLGATIQSELDAPRTVTSIAEPLEGTAYPDGYLVTDREFRVRDGEVVRTGE